MAKSVVTTDPRTAKREPKKPDPPKPKTPNEFQALCIVAQHFQGKPAAWLELRDLLDRVSHHCPPERFYQEFKSILEQGK